MFLFAVLLIFLSSSAEAADMKSSLNEIYAGRQPVSNFVITLEEFSTIQGKLFLKIDGDGNAEARRTCTLDAGCVAPGDDCKEITTKGRIEAEKIRTILKLIIEGNILDMKREYPPMPCDDQSILTIDIKGAGKFTTQVGQRYFKREPGFSKLHDFLVICESQLHSRKDLSR